MTVPQTGAASRRVEPWDSVGWSAATKAVRRLQARIVKATREGRWNKVRALQHLLTHSRSGKLLAVQRVTESDGKGTPGVDGEIWDTPAKKANATHSLRRRGYQPLPLRRVYPNGKLLIKPSKKNTRTFLQKVRELVRQNTGAPTAALIRQLNPVIRGWANYHRHIVAKRVFSRVDNVIFRLLWKWARRRHPRKGARWVKRRYFDRVGTRDWWFFADAQTRDGQTLRLRLVHATATPIRRHIKVRSEANPYDPADYEYFETRRRHGKPSLPDGSVPRPDKGR
jgi:retron-type reverse transcriptase